MRALTLALAVGLTVSAAMAAAATGADLSPEKETEMALSAAPEHLRDGASVYLLGADGFAKSKEGSNGFSCLVLREGPVLAPICYDAEGSRTTLLTNLRRAELMAAGKSDAEAEAVVAGEYEAGKLRAPERPGIAYMLSPDFVRVDPETGARSQVFPPHLMFYAPYLSNEDIGAAAEDTGSTTKPWVLDPGQPTAYVIIVPPAVAAE